jgi:hypothetical protein
MGWGMGGDVPDSKEAYWYRTMFDEHFPSYCADTVMRWTPTWSAQTDPSGRYVQPFPLVCWGDGDWIGTTETNEYSAIAVHEQKYESAQ